MIKKLFRNFLNSSSTQKITIFLIRNINPIISFKINDTYYAKKHFNYNNNLFLVLNLEIVL
jgi:hypothetical protein